jgi:hypothetical protein
MDEYLKIINEKELERVKVREDELAATLDQMRVHEKEE